MVQAGGEDRNAGLDTLRTVISSVGHSASSRERASNYRGGEEPYCSRWDTVGKKLGIPNSTWGTPTEGILHRDCFTGNRGF